MRMVNMAWLIIIMLVVRCSSVPMSGRSQLSLVSNAKIFPVSFEQYEQVKREGEIEHATEDARMVKRVGVRIQRAVEQYFVEKGNANYLRDYQWEFNLINDNIVNAWCMPGGKVAFYTGIMPICADEDGVAVVMGHEIAHAIANHGRERISQQYAAQAGLTAVGIALGMGGSTTIPPDIVMQGAGAVTSLGILAFSRKHESEADKLGLYFMAMAGYDPRNAPEFWKRMAANSDDEEQPPEFVSTHPSHETRISDLKANMPKALEYYHKSKN